MVAAKVFNKLLIRGPEQNTEGQLAKQEADQHVRAHYEGVLSKMAWKPEGEDREHAIRSLKNISGGRCNFEDLGEVITSKHRFDEIVGLYKFYADPGRENLHSQFDVHREFSGSELMKELLKSDDCFNHLVNLANACLENKYQFWNGFAPQIEYALKEGVITSEDHFSRLTDVLADGVRNGVDASLIFNGLSAVQNLIESPDGITKYGGKLVEIGIASKNVKEGEKEVQASNLTSRFSGIAYAYHGKKEPNWLFRSENGFNRFAELAMATAKRGYDPADALDAFHAVPTTGPESHFNSAMDVALRSVEQGLRPFRAVRALGYIWDKLESPEQVAAYGEKFSEVFAGCKQKKASRDAVDSGFGCLRHLIKSPEDVEAYGKKLIEAYTYSMASQIRGMADDRVLAIRLEAAKNVIKSPEDIATYVQKAEKFEDALIAILKDKEAPRFLETMNAFGGMSGLITTEERFDKLADSFLAAWSNYRPTGYGTADWADVSFSSLRSLNSMITSDARFNKILDYTNAAVAARHSPSVSQLERLGDLITSDTRFNTLVDFLTLCEKTGSDSHNIANLLASNKEILSSEHRFNRTFEFLTRCVEAKFNPAPALTSLAKITGPMTSDARIDSLFKLAEAGLPRGFEPATTFDKLSSIKEIITSDERFNRLMELGMLCIEKKKSASTALGAFTAVGGMVAKDEMFNAAVDAAEASLKSGVYPGELVKFGLPALQDRISSPADVAKYSEVLINSAKTLPEGMHREYFAAVFDSKAFEELTSPQCLDCLQAMGEGVGNKFLSEIRKSDASTPRCLLGLWGSSREGIMNVIDRMPELAIYHGRLQKQGYDASAEIAFLVKKGNKAEITRLALNLQQAHTIGKQKDALKYVGSLEGQGFRPEERIKAIDSLAAYSKALTIVPEHIIAELTAKASTVFAEQPQASAKELGEKYPDVMEYIDRHFKHAAENPAYQSPLKREELISLVSQCFAFGKNLDLSTVNTEKQQLKQGKNVDFKPKYENKFLTEINGAAERARYDAFLDAVNIHHTILETICGEKLEKKELSRDFQNVLEGYFRLNQNKEILASLIRVYYLEGPEAAKKWADGLEGNVKALNLMRERGTNIEAMRNFEVTYDAVGSQTMAEASEIRAAQVYSETLSLLHQLGYKDLKELGVEETQDRDANAIAIAKKLNGLVKEGKFSTEQKVIVDDINMHVDALKSSVGQLHTATETGKVTFFIASDPIKAMQLGVGFPSCLNIINGCNAHGAVDRALSANQPTLYAADGNRFGQPNGRASLMESNEGFFLNSHFYGNTTRDYFNPEAGWISVLVKFSTTSGRDVIIVPKLFTVSEQIKASLKAAGFVEQQFDVHIEKGACDQVYSDLGFSGYMGAEGKDVSFSGYVYKSKAQQSA